MESIKGGKARVESKISDVQALFSEHEIAIAIPGKPIAKARPRFVCRGNHRAVFDSQRDEKRTCREQMRIRIGNHQPLSGPLSVSVVFVYARPKSRSKNEVVHSIKPDIDNLLKWILDIGNGMLWVDDSQIAATSSIKIYGETPKTVITVSTLGVNGDGRLR